MNEEHQTDEPAPNFVMAELSVHRIEPGDVGRVELKPPDDTDDE